MQVITEVMQCGIALGDTDGLKECIKEFDAAAEVVAYMIQDSEALYTIDEKRDQLRELLAERGHYLEQWLEVQNHSDIKSYDSPRLLNAIVAAVVLDKPDVALTLMRLFSHQVRNDAIPAKDSFRFCLSLISTMTWLYDRPEPLGAHKQRIEGAGKIVAAFRELIQHIDDNQLLPETDRASLFHFFSVIDQHYRSEAYRLEAMEQRVLDTGAELVKEEEARKRKIQAKLEKRKRRRQKRLLEQQAQQLEKLPVDEPVAAAADSPTHESGVSLNAALIKALDAYARNEPNGVINAAFQEVTKDENASAFDKAQAHYGYADILSARMTPLLEKLNELVEATYDYEQVLLTNQIPPPDDEYRFNNVLRELKGQVEGINWALLEIAQSIKSALDIFYKLGEDKVEFLEQLLELHDQAEILMEKAGNISRCCEKLPQIYELRGQVLGPYLTEKRERRGHHNAEAAERRKEKKKIIEANLNQIKDFSLKLGGSIRFMRAVLDREKAEREVQHIQQRPSHTLNPAAAPFIPDTMRAAAIRAPAESPAIPANDGVHQGQPLKSAIRSTEPAKQRRSVHFADENIMEVLPDLLRNELQLLLGRTGKPLKFSDQAEALPLDAFNPDNGIKPHPLTLLATKLGRSLVIVHHGQQWLTTLHGEPSELTGGAIPKGSVTVDLDALHSLQKESAEEPQLDQSPVTRQPVETTNRFVESAADSTSDRVHVSQPRADSLPFEMPMGFFMPGDLFSSLEKCLKDTGLVWKMGKSSLIGSAAIDPQGASAKAEPAQPVKSKKKGKGKKQKRAGKVQTEIKEDFPEATEHLMQLRVRDYLKAVITRGKNPAGKSLPERFDLGGVKARVRNETFLRHPYGLEDFAILADALGVRIRLTSAATDVFNCKPGLGKPVKIEMNEYPDEPYLSLEYIACEKEHHWFTSLPHFFEYLEEQTAEDLGQKSGQSRSR